MLNFLLRVLLVAMGLVVAAGLAVAVMLLLAAWYVRALWGRITGRPVSPFIMRVDPRRGFDNVVRRREIGDVTDVEVKARDPQEPRERD